MKFQLFVSGLLIICFSGFLSPVRSIYDPLSVPNNRFGIHVFSPDEVENAAQLVNSSGGDWGYVTVPIRANDRSLETWERFMQKCQELHIIPILRLASFPIGDKWDAPNEYSLIDFANFLDQLPWPTKNRYVIIYNEPNHKNEWGGFVYPEEYARILSRAADILHKKHADFFVISAGMDSSAPNGDNSMNAYSYFRAMNSTIPGIFSQVDGVSFHSYGNPAFSSRPNIYSPVNISGFRKEGDFIKRQFGITPKIFLTEAGWRRDLTGDRLATDFYRFALDRVWTEDVVALTPFIFSAPSGPFEGFSFLRPDGSYYPFAQYYQEFPKTTGQPLRSEKKPDLTMNATIQEKKEEAGITGNLSSLFARVYSIVTKIFNR